MKILSSDLDKALDNLFSRHFINYEPGLLEKHIVNEMRKFILPEKDRAKIVLKCSFCSFYDSIGNVKYSCLHPARFIVNRFANIIKNSNLEKSLKWINSIQEHSNYRMDLLKICRQSNARPKDKWYSKQQSMWSLSGSAGGNRWSIKNFVLIMPSFNDSVSYIKMDAFRSAVGFEYNHSFNGSNSFLKNDFKLYPFALTLNLDEICSSIMSLA